jgi:adenylate cyclase
LAEQEAGLRAQWTHFFGPARLISGLTLFFYVLTHNLNHALGLISLDALEAGRAPFVAFWRYPPIQWLFYLAAVTHFLLAMHALYNRHSLRMPFWEAAQLVLGISAPPLLMLHFLGTAIASEAFGIQDGYDYVLLSLFSNPKLTAVQTAAVLVTWIHGCIGLAYWLRLKPWFARARAYLFAAALLVPVLALLGFAEAGRAVMALAATPGWFADLVQRRHIPGPEAGAQLYSWLYQGLMIYGGILLGVLGLRLLRSLLIRRRSIQVRYPDGRMVQIQPGTTLLEASRIGNIPHASVCGGRGRCSTCRVKILAGSAKLAPADEDELQVLARVGAAPGTRLACQSRPTGPIKIAPLLPATAGPRYAAARPDYHSGKEQEIAVLFADLRGFTQFSEQRLPYDVVFLLNRYFRAMGEAVNAAGGHLDKFIGDGVMALFGVDGKPELACTQALDAARRMGENLEALNMAFLADLKTPLRIGIGIHFGPAIVGEMGFGQTQTLTAIGDTVNTASRLETATKEFDCQLMISESVATGGGLDLAIARRHDVSLRGRTEMLVAYAIKDAKQLAEIR